MRINPDDHTPIPPSPLGGFYTQTGHFIWRARPGAAHTLCGKILTGGDERIVLGPDSVCSCRRCVANIAKWRKRAPCLLH